jgi:hypothetical protein
MNHRIARLAYLLTPHAYANEPGWPGLLWGGIVSAVLVGIVVAGLLA